MGAHGRINKPNKKNVDGYGHLIEPFRRDRLLWSVYKHDSVQPAPEKKPSRRDDTCALCGYYSRSMKGVVVNGYCKGEVACRRRQVENRGMGLDVDEALEEGS